MKKIWTTVTVLAIVLVTAGVICGAAAYLNGGNFASLMENREAAFVIEWLKPANMIPSLLGA